MWQVERLLRTHVPRLCTSPGAGPYPIWLDSRAQLRVLAMDERDNAWARWLPAWEVIDWEQDGERLSGEL